MAIHKAVSLCLSRPAIYTKDIVIVSDSKIAVSWVNNNGFGSLNHVGTVNDIRAMLTHFGRTSVIYSLRASNSFADSLAKKASNMEEDILNWGEF